MVGLKGDLESLERWAASHQLNGQATSSSDKKKNKTILSQEVDLNWNKVGYDPKGDFAFFICGSLLLSHLPERHRIFILIFFHSLIFQQWHSHSLSSKNDIQIPCLYREIFL